MGTYEDLFKNNPNLEKLIELHFNTHGMRLSNRNYSAEIYGNPLDYLDIAQNAKNLQYINIDPNQNMDFFEGLKLFANQANDDVRFNSNTVSNCTKEEFLNGEKIIESVIAEMNPTWSTKQKLAFVHYKMGNLVTYHADYNSKCIPPIADSIAASRNIWKALNDGVSVCNGIVSIERTILSRVGVKTQYLSSGTHEFLLTETDEGNIISDATWDLAYTKFGCRPQFLGLSYEQFRMADGDLSKAHKLEQIPQNIISFSKDEITELYDSIGILDKNKKFPTPIVTMLADLNEKYPNLRERASNAFTNFSHLFPEKMKDLSEVQQMMGNVLQWTGINFKDYQSNFVYNVNDKSFKNTNLVFKVASQEGTFFKILDPKTREFKDIDEKELDSTYQLHTNSKEIKFWQTSQETQEKNSSEKNIEEVSK